MSVFKATREVPAPAIRVFDFLADGARHAAWIAQENEGARPVREVVKTRHLSGPEVGEGATYHLRLTLGGKEMKDHEFRTEVYEPARRLVFRAEMGFDLAFDLEEIPAGTLLTCTRDHNKAPRGFLDRFISRRLAPKYAEASIADDLARIERALEAAGSSAEGAA